MSVVALAACFDPEPASQAPDAGAPAIVEVARPADADRCTVTSVDCESATFTCHDVPAGFVFDGRGTTVGQSPTGWDSLTFQTPSHSGQYSTWMCPEDPVGTNAYCEFEFDSIPLPAGCPERSCYDPNACDFGYPEQCFAYATTTQAFPIQDHRTFSMPLQVTGEGFATGAKVTVDITHPYSSDLVITLLDPDLKPYVLWNREGGPGNFGYRTFNVTFPGKRLRKGIWWLQVSDKALWDEGTCWQWTIDMDPYCGP